MNTTNEFFVNFYFFYIPDVRLQYISSSKVRGIKFCKGMLSSPIQLSENGPESQEIWRNGGLEKIKEILATMIGGKV